MALIYNDAFRSIFNYLNILNSKVIAFKQFQRNVEKYINDT